MKAIQYVEAGRPEWVEVPDPEAGKGQVVVAVRGVTTCPHWDLHIMAGKSMAPGGVVNYPYPVGQPGHEAMGEVTAVGPGVEDLKVGDTVAFWQDQGAGRSGCYAEQVLAEANNLLKVSPAYEPQQIASLELAMCVQVSFDQVLNITAIEGKRMAISGLGPAGLVALQMAKAYGAAEVIAFDPLSSRRELALELGATRVLNPLDEKAWPQDRFSPDALDLAIDCTGLNSAVQYLMHRTRSVVALFGVLREEVQFGFRHWCRGLHLVGYGDHNRAAAERALALIDTGKLRLDPLVSKTLPLTAYAEGVELLKAQQAIKVCFIP
ncbi:MAG: zinc-binding dehydrogenase [Opitutales bacterium]|nr:zinc-binding dehydrogenase [Opitutales bacterium]